MSLSDAVWSGRRYRTLNVIDEFNREGLRIEVHTSLPAARVIRALNELVEVRDMTADWLHRYNHHRPHESLGRIAPVEYRVKQFPHLYF